MSWSKAERGDIILDADSDSSGDGAVRLRRQNKDHLVIDEDGSLRLLTGGTERGRVDAAGTASGVFAGGGAALDSDLTTIGALDSSTAGAIGSDGAGWVKKTYAQFKTALALVAADVGLGNVTNAAQLTASQLDTDGTLTANSDAKVASQKAVKTYIDTAVSVIPETSQAGTAYTLVLADKGTAVGFTSASAVTVTVPPSVFAVGTQLELYQAGTGTVTVAPGAGVTLHSPGGTLATSGQYATLVLRQVSTDVWVVGGELTSSAVDKTILDAKGDLIVASAADTPAKLTVGANGTVLRADSTQTTGQRWAREKDNDELRLSGLGLVTANFDPITVTAQSSPVSQSLYAMREGLREGMAVTGLMLAIQTAAAGTAPTGAFVGIADPNGVVRVQSGNLNASAAWNSTGFQTFSFGSTYTVPSDGGYLAFLLVNGTWETTQPLLSRQGGSIIDDVRLDARAAALTAPPANGSSLTLVSTAVLHFWLGCVGS